MLDAALERLVEILSSEEDGEGLARARLAFFARTGEFEPGEPWYEARIQYFFDWYLAGFVDPSAHPSLGRDELGLLRACARSFRGLFLAEGPLPDGRFRLAEQLGGAAFRVHAGGRLQDGDRFDGRIIVVEDTLHLAPGIIFHPPPTHQALDELLGQLADRRSQGARFEREDVLDGLLRMRMRLDRFTSMRAEHVYRFDGLGDADILSAAWARHKPEDP